MRCSGSTTGCSRPTPPRPTIRSRRRCARSCPSCTAAVTWPSTIGRRLPCNSSKSASERPAPRTSRRFSTGLPPCSRRQRLLDKLPITRRQLQRQRRRPAAVGHLFPRPGDDVAYLLLGVLCGEVGELVL